MNHYLSQSQSKLTLDEFLRILDIGLVVAFDLIRHLVNVIHITNIVLSSEELLDLIENRTGRLEVAHDLNWWVSSRRG